MTLFQLKVRSKLTIKVDGLATAQLNPPVEKSLAWVQPKFNSATLKAMVVYATILLLKDLSRMFLFQLILSLLFKVILSNDGQLVQPFLRASGSYGVLGQRRSQMQTRRAG